MKMQRRVIIILLFISSIFFTLLGMLENIRPFFTKPSDRYYTGLQGFVDDYVGYVSYVKEGMYGRNTFRIRSLPPPQTSTTAQLILILMGKIGVIFNFSAPFTYHLFRALFGIGFFLSIYFLLKVKFNHFYSLLITIVTAVSGQIGWYVSMNNNLIYKTIASFGFTDNIALRFASRPHYLFGAMLFCIISTIHLKTGKKKYTAYITFSLSICLGLIHPSFGVILGFMQVFMLLYVLITKKTHSFLIASYSASLSGLFIGLLASYWSTHQYPYTSILAFEAYVMTEKLSIETILGDIISFGPSLWLGLPTLVFLCIKYKCKDRVDLYMLIWLSVQLGIFFVAYKYFRSERVRYIQSLYFIPMTYGAIRLFELISGTKKQLFFIFVFLLFGLGIPGYINGLEQSMYYHTNYQTYSYFIFPTKYIMDAYAWLDKNTPTESVVLASWEAANNIIMYSHNYVIGNKQGWPNDEGYIMERDKDSFYSGIFSKNEAIAFIKKYNIQFIYAGYQEPNEFINYGFAKQIFQNPEVTIYKIQY